MDPEEERVLYLSRVGNSQIFKQGTYNVVANRAITQDHPYYVKREDGLQKISYIPPQGSAAFPADQAPAGTQSAPDASAAGGDDPEALAAAVISSNFKVGLSQEEVDALLNGMN